MVPTHFELLVHQERYESLLKEAEQERMLRAANIRPSVARKLYREATEWLGIRLVTWGCTLASPDALPACHPQPA